MPSPADACALTLAAQARDGVGTDAAFGAPSSQRGRFAARLVTEVPVAWLRQAVSRVLASGKAEVIDSVLDAASTSDARAVADFFGAPVGSDIDCLALVPMLGHGRYQS